MKALPVDVAMRCASVSLRQRFYTFMIKWGRKGYQSSHLMGVIINNNHHSTSKARHSCSCNCVCTFSLSPQTASSEMNENTHPFLSHAGFSSILCYARLTLGYTVIPPKRPTLSRPSTPLPPLLFVDGISSRLMFISLLTMTADIAAYLLACFLTPTQGRRAL